MFDPKNFFDLVDPNKNIIVAFSGGGDSSALLHFCHELNQQGLLQGSLSAIHINHSLNKDSDLWERSLQDILQGEKYCLSESCCEYKRKKIRP